MSSVRKTCAKRAQNAKYLPTPADSSRLKSTTKTESETEKTQKTTQEISRFGSKMLQVRILSPRLQSQRSPKSHVRTRCESIGFFLWPFARPSRQRLTGISAFTTLNSIPQASHVEPLVHHLLRDFLWRFLSTLQLRPVGTKRPLPSLASRPRRPLFVIAPVGMSGSTPARSKCFSPLTVALLQVFPHARHVRTAL